MNKEGFKKFAKNIGVSISRRSPEILIGLGITGMISTTVLAVKATPKALMLIEEKKRDEYLTELTPIETVKTTWKCYIPAAASGVFSIACIVGACSVHNKRVASLATAYKISERALTEYKSKVIETIGEKKEKSIREDIAKDRIDRNPVSRSEVIITEKGNTLCYDAISGRYFKSDIEKIRRIVNELNRKMTVGMEMYISLNEFYREIGIETTSIGDELGWNINDGFIELDFSSRIADDGNPCIVVDYLVAPRYDFSKLM